jgi:hypothetical protein
MSYLLKLTQRGYVKLTQRNILKEKRSTFSIFVTKKVTSWQPPVLNKKM